jgi:ectoine hydroxylase-related dioxygenase (phytanoyl-CoA dioxygenase family)
MNSNRNILPALESDYPLTSEQIAAYQRDGHILLRGVCTPEEVAAYREAIVETALRFNPETRKLEERDTYGRAFLQTMSLCLKSEIVQRFVYGRRFAKIAAELMGVAGVRLYHDQALFKEAGGGHTPWHQDHYYWPLDTPNTITLWMPLVNVTSAMGTMTFASGSHHRGLLGHIAISDESEAIFQRYVTEQNLPLAPSGAMAAGDATFHSGLTLHAAPGNSSAQRREAMTIIYYEDGIRLLQPDNPNREFDRRAIFPEGKPGEPAISEFTPLLYRRGEE